MQDISFISINISDQLPIYAEGLTSKIYIYNANNGQTYAIKKFKPNYSENERKREIELNCKINSPYIVKCYGNTINYLVLEKFGDYSLLEYLLATKLQLQHTQYIFRQIVVALAYLEEQGFYHRDIKMDNILIDSNTLQIKLCDLGFTILKGESSNRGVGTIGYMAPELFDQSKTKIESDQIEKAEVFALGVILFNLVTIQMPFKNQNSCELWRLIENQQWSKYWCCHSKFYIPLQIRKLIQSMLVVDPSQRISLKDILNSEFLNCKIY